MGLSKSQAGCEQAMKGQDKNCPSPGISRVDGHTHEYPVLEDLGQLLCWSNKSQLSQIVRLKAGLLEVALRCVPWLMI